MIRRAIILLLTATAAHGAGKGGETSEIVRRDPTSYEIEGAVMPGLGLYQVPVPRHERVKARDLPALARPELANVGPMLGQYCRQGVCVTIIKPAPKAPAPLPVALPPTDTVSVSALPIPDLVPPPSIAEPIAELVDAAESAPDALAPLINALKDAAK